ncbi:MULTISPECIES: alpha/beta fold hydrolase [unclassified Mesorhizobium]|uniref:alpha/beta fold hydrolase n=1 Tax=unclassified Mesorhizobium TaxID=325217 RepID=UPI001CCD174F|nr:MULTISPECIES: alpha/beta hydrolase [unclassified Mesorhizobium]MBZ9742826.1 alpha/beta hydrolase [Mesorhizobium sp. CO1-1-4]MBZ9805976.1 alpha/beta hydrolase [Mesorhizobium sp. ES1-6]
MFDGFRLEKVRLTSATLRVRVGGSGPAILLLHGHPRTHVTWHKVADLLVKDHTVVCPDLRGFGQSSIPDDTTDHSGSSKRAKAQDCIELMRYLGFDRFAAVGHDRGSYTAFRLAMDHPAAVSRLMILDGVPILEALERCDARFAAAWWHWFFFAQPDKPERAISAAPEQWYGGSPGEMGKEAYADYLEAIRNPEIVHGMIEDYRAGLSIDHLHDAEDRRSGRRIQCPMAVLWSLKDDLEALYGDILAIWRPWAGSTLIGKGLPSGHHMAEEIPDMLAFEINTFVAPDRAANPR